MEQYYKGLSSELGLTPGQGQASGWVGNGQLTGLKSDDAATWLQLWQNRINNTAMRMGKTPQETEAGFWQGKHPLLTSGGVPIGPLMQQFQGEPPPDSRPTLADLCPQPVASALGSWARDRPWAQTPRTRTGTGCPRP